MNLLIAVLMMLGVNCGPDQLKDQKFLDQNKVQIEKANEMINSGEVTPDMLERGGIVITDESGAKN